jgi:hypothetical protein
MDVAGTALIALSGIQAVGLVYLAGYSLNNLRKVGEELRTQPRASITQTPPQP